MPLMVSICCWLTSLFPHYKGSFLTTTLFLYIIVYPVFADLAFTNVVSPMLMFDYAAPKEFPVNKKRPLGVGQHPHRGKYLLLADVAVSSLYRILPQPTLATIVPFP